MATSTKVHASFDDLGLSQWLITQCQAVGLRRPTPVQSACIPEILKGRDTIGCAQTGSGKTAAFGLPILQNLAEDPYGVYCLILTPIRELALQISEQLGALGRPINLKVAVIVGGMDMVEQASLLEKKPHIVIATPGRLVDHIETSDWKFMKIRYLVLDEADRLLSEGNFSAQLATIFSRLSRHRQTLLFSATMNDALCELQRIAMSDPFSWEDAHMSKQVTVSQLDQRYVLVPANVKDSYLVHLVTEHLAERKENSILLFTNTCKRCQLLSMTLSRLLPDTPCSSLHSRRPQRHRLAALAAFRSQRLRLLVCTDVACRGLDIPHVSLVLNADVPRLASSYVHRVGRTARAGRAGRAVTLVTQYDIDLIHAVEEKIKTKLEELTVSEDDVLPILTEVAVAKSACRIQMAENDFDEKGEVNLRKDLILAGKDPDRIRKPKNAKSSKKFSSGIATSSKKSKNSKS